MIENSIFQIRSKTFNFDVETIASNWNDENPCLTQVFNVASVIAEVGESIMVKQSSRFLKKIENENLKARVKIFFGQEATHRHTHTHYNQCLRDAGYKVDRLLAIVRWFLFSLVKFLPEKWLLASMVSSEYITSMIAERTFERGFGNQVMTSDSEVARFWRWHLAEEVEHRTILHELYQEIHGSSALLQIMTWLMSVFFYILLNIGNVIFLINGPGSILKKTRSTLGFNFGTKGACWWLIGKLCKGSIHKFDAAFLCRSTPFAEHL